MADIGSITLKLDPPVIDIPALEASVRSAIADALEQLAAEVRGEEPAEPTRWNRGAVLTIEDLEELPVGAVVVDGDGDSSEKRSPAEPHYPGGDIPCWADPGAVVDGPDWLLTSTYVASFPPVTLVSLP